MPKKPHILALIALTLFAPAAHAQTLPAPAQDVVLQSTPGKETITLAGGCFWGVQAVFQHVKGVQSAPSGYTGGASTSAHYDLVSSGATGHAEAVQVTYDPSQITLGQLLQIYFAVAHNPTQLNAQGPDHGTQYRSTIFYSTPDQKKIAETYIAQLNAAKTFSAPIATTLEPLKTFYPAEAYHQDYAKTHPDNPYIAINDLPKVAALEKQFPQYYTP